MGFKDLVDLKAGYDSGIDDILNDFYIPVLKQAKSYKRMAGFFSSSSLSVAARGLIGLIKNGGSMELLVSPHLSEEDIKMIEQATEDPDQVISNIMVAEIDNIEHLLQKRRVDALGWLMAKGLLKIKIVTVYDAKGRLMNYKQIEESGLFHIKVGVLEDENGDIITFSGSVNETASAWVRNIEEFKVFKLWDSGNAESAKIDIDKFEKYWSGSVDKVKILDLPLAVSNKIIKKAPKEITDIEEELVELERKEQEKKITLSFHPFDYQLDALSVWQKNHKAIFEMATGSGKTKTAQLCIADFIQNCETPAVIFIVCPQNTLAKQWLDDIKKSGLPWENYVICDSTTNSWKSTSTKGLEFKLINTSIECAGEKKVLFVYVTFDTFCRDKFISIVQKNKSDLKYFIIGDEVHGLGSSERLKGLLNIYDYRLGLSATPERWFDESGTKLISDYFGTDRFTFTIADALEKINPLTGKTYLTPYEYYPKFVSLEPEEIEKYRNITQKIIKSLGKAKGDKNTAEKIERLMFLRSTIHKSAVNKLQEFEKILAEIETDIADTIIFVSSEQIDDVEKIMRKHNIRYRRFTKDQDTKPEKKFGNISEREHIIKMFKEGDCQCLVAIKCLDEGIDIPSAKRAILLASSTNPREYVQRIGRVIRRSDGKEKAFIYDIIIEPSELGNPELTKYEHRIFERELNRVTDISENADNRWEIINICYEKRSSLG